MSSGRKSIILSLPLLALTLAGCSAVQTAAISAGNSTAAGAPLAAAPDIAVADTGWGFPVYDIPVDDTIRFGILDNGMKFAILKNQTPAQTASVRMGFDVGWIDERDSELGLAHFIEHMAFNGTTNVPEGEMIKILEREGLAFGADTNASTNFEETQYKLDLPRADPALLGTALMLMRETASEIVFDPAAIDRERGVLQSETRTRNTFQIRQYRDYFNFVSPDTAFAKRFRAPGTSESVTSSNAETLRGLYERYYRPDNATLVVVGDFDADLVEQAIRERFADWERPSAPIQNVDKGAIAMDRPAAARIFVDPDVNYGVTIDRFAPYKKERATVSDSREALKVALGGAILDRRFARIVNAPDAPILGAGAGVTDYFDVADQASVRVIAKEGEWESALGVAEQEVRRALQFGFTDAEVTEQLANFALSFRSGAEQAGTRRNAALAEAILATAADESVIITPQTRLEVFEQIKPDLTAESVSAAFAAAFAGSQPLIHVTSKEPITGGPDTILAAYSASQNTVVEPLAASAGKPFAYTEFGTPGTAASDTMIDDLEIRTIRFANNVMLNLKKTDFEQGKVRFHVGIGSGVLALPPREGLALFMNSMYAAAGLGEHSFDELQQTLAGRDVSYGLGTADDHFHIGGTTTMADLPLQMQVSAAYLTDPGYRKEAQSRWAALVPPFTAQLDSSPQSVAQRDVAKILTNGDPRFGIPAQATLETITLGDLRDALAPVLANAPIEISVVGDIDEAAVIAAVAQTFGALPERKTEKADFEAARQVRFAQDTAPVTLYHAGEPDQGLISVYWPTDDDDDAVQDAELSMLAEVVNLKLLEVIREELGASYTPQAASSMSSVYRDYGTFQASVVVAPEQRDEVFAAIDEIAASLRDTAIDPDLLERARKPVMEGLALRKRENGYWIGVAENAQSMPERLDRVRDADARVAAITPARLQAAARRYLTKNRQLRIAIVHESLMGE